jgi:hypothetical protein
MLRKLTFERGAIAKTMAFAIDHSDAADEIVEIICKTLIIKETPIPTKVARLYLVSDILHNSSVSVPNAWKFRTGFESKLPEVFEHLNEVYRSITARLKAETFRVSDQKGLRFILMLICYYLIQKEKKIFTFCVYFKTKSDLNYEDFTHLFLRETFNL